MPLESHKFLEGMKAHLLWDLEIYFDVDFT